MSIEALKLAMREGRATMDRCALKIGLRMTAADEAEFRTAIRFAFDGIDRALAAHETALQHAGRADADAQAPDMFWNADGGERPKLWNSIEELVDGHHVGNVVIIDCAKWLPSVRVRVLEQGYEVLAARAEKGGA